jgi:hypothetical protein
VSDYLVIHVHDATELRQVDNRGLYHPEARDRAPRWLVMPAERAARIIVRAVARRRREVVVTGHGKLLVWLARHAPGLVAFGLGRAGYRGRPEAPPAPR